MHLISATDILRARCASATTTTAPSVTVYSKVLDTATKALSDITKEAVALNGTSNVTIAAAPSTGTRKQITQATILNRDTIAHTVTLEAYNGTTAYPEYIVQLAAGESAIFADGVWARYSGGGILQTSQAANWIATGTETITHLTSDVNNSASAADVLENVTGLLFAVVTGGVYKFRFNILYTSSTISNGSVWTITGPTTTRLVYMSEYSLTSTTTTRNANLTAYSLPATSNSSSGTTDSNYAVIEGFIIPSADGNVQALFAKELLAGTTTAKAGSFVSVIRIL